MVWIYIVIAIAAVATALLEFYVRFLPALRGKRKRKQEAKLEIQSQVEIAVVYVECYDWGGIGSLQKAFNEAPISKRLREELNDLIKHATEYFKWRYECFQVVNAEVRAQSKYYNILNAAFRHIFGSPLEEVFQGTDNTISYDIFKEIYKNKLTFNMAKESVLKGRWDRKVSIADEHSVEREIMFKDIIDGDEFHKFIESLIKLQTRESIKTLRDNQAIFLRKAKTILETLNATG